MNQKEQTRYIYDDFKLWKLVGFHGLYESILAL